MNRNLMILTALSGMLAVALGAFGAHGLKPHLDPTQLSTFQTATQYHFYHTLASLLTLLLARFSDNKSYNTAAVLFLSGILLFSGSLYFLSTYHLLGFSGLSRVAILTPFGGLSFILGWGWLGWAAYKGKAGNH